MQEGDNGEQILFSQIRRSWAPHFLTLWNRSWPEWPPCQWVLGTGAQHKWGRDKSLTGKRIKIWRDQREASLSVPRRRICFGCIPCFSERSRSYFLRRGEKFACQKGEMWRRHMVTKFPYLSCPLWTIAFSHVQIYHSTAHSLGCAQHCSWSEPVSCFVSVCNDYFFRKQRVS